MPRPKIALCIGCNYPGTYSELSGCVNDVRNVAAMLTSQFGFDDVRILVDDDAREGELPPTHANILAELHKLVADCSCASDVFIHYSGHGSYTRDRSGDESDGRDEVIVPTDYTQAGMVTDDELNGILSGFRSSVRLTCLMDCCHSGSVLDLQYTYDLVHGMRIREENATCSIRCDAVMISGCTDLGTSADVQDGVQANGAMTTAFLNVMESFQYIVTCHTLVSEMRLLLQTQGMIQIPQLSSTCRLNAVTPFAAVTLYAKSPTLKAVRQR